MSILQFMSNSPGLTFVLAVLLVILVSNVVDSIASRNRPTCDCQCGGEEEEIVEDDNDDE